MKIVLKIFPYVIYFYYLRNTNKEDKIMTTNNTRKEKVGQYFYGCHRNYYGVWVWDHVWENGASGRFVADFNTREEARAFVWKMNGWGTPKTALVN